MNIRRNIITTPLRKKQNPYSHRKFPSSNLEASLHQPKSYSNHKPQITRSMKPSNTEKMISQVNRTTKVQQQVAAFPGEHNRRPPHHTNTGSNKIIPSHSHKIQTRSGNKNWAVLKTKSEAIGSQNPKPQNNSALMNAHALGQLRSFNGFDNVNKNKINFLGGKSKFNAGKADSRFGANTKLGSLKRIPSGHRNHYKGNIGTRKPVRRIGLGDRRNPKLSKTVQSSSLSNKLKLNLYKNRKPMGLGGGKLLRKGSSNSNNQKLGSIKRNLIAGRVAKPLGTLRSLKIGSKRTHQIPKSPLKSESQRQKDQEFQEIKNKRDEFYPVKSQGVQHIGQIHPNKVVGTHETKELSQCGFGAKIGRDTKDTDKTKGKNSRENQIIEETLVVAEVFNEESEVAVEKANVSKHNQLHNSGKWDLRTQHQKPTTLGGPIPELKAFNLPPSITNKDILTLSEGPIDIRQNKGLEPTALAPPLKKQLSLSQPATMEPKLKADPLITLRGSDPVRFDLHLDVTPSKKENTVDVNPFTRSNSQHIDTELPDLGVGNLGETTEQEKERMSNMIDIEKDLFVNRRKTKYSKIIDESLKVELVEEYDKQMEILHEEEEENQKKDKKRKKRDLDTRRKLTCLTNETAKQENLAKVKKENEILEKIKEQKISREAGATAQTSSNTQKVKVVRMKWDGKKYQQVTEYQSIRSSIGSRTQSRKHSYKAQDSKTRNQQTRNTQNQTKPGVQAEAGDDSVQSNIPFRESIGRKIIRDSRNIRDSGLQQRTSIPFSAVRSGPQSQTNLLSEPRGKIQNTKSQQQKQQARQINNKNFAMNERVSIPRVSQKRIVSPPHQKVEKKDLAPLEVRHSIDRRLDEPNQKKPVSPEPKRRDSKFEELKKFVNTPKQLNSQNFFDSKANGLINSASTKNILQNLKLDMKKSHSSYALPEAALAKEETLDRAQAFANISNHKPTPPPTCQAGRLFFEKDGRRMTQYYDDADKDFLARFEDFGQCPENEYRIVVFRMEKRFKADKIFFNNPINFIEPEIRIKFQADKPQSQKNTTGKLMNSLKCQKKGKLSNVKQDSIYYDMSQVVLQKKTLKPSVYHDLAALEDDFMFPEDKPKAVRKPVFHNLNNGAKQIGENTFVLNGIEFRDMRGTGHSKSATNLHSLGEDKTSDIIIVSTHIPLGARREPRKAKAASRMRGGLQYKSSTNLHRTEAYKGNSHIPSNLVSSNASFTNCKNLLSLRRAWVSNILFSQVTSLIIYQIPYYLQEC